MPCPLRCVAIIFLIINELQYNPRSKIERGLYYNRLIIRWLLATGKVKVFL